MLPLEPVKKLSETRSQKEVAAFNGERLAAVKPVTQPEAGPRLRLAVERTAKQDAGRRDAGHKLAGGQHAIVKGVGAGSGQRRHAIVLRRPGQVFGDAVEAVARAGRRRCRGQQIVRGQSGRGRFRTGVGTRIAGHGWRKSQRHGRGGAGSGCGGQGQGKRQRGGRGENRRPPASRRPFVPRQTDSCAAAGAGPGPVASGPGRRGRLGEPGRRRRRVRPASGRRRGPGRRAPRPALAPQPRPAQGDRCGFRTRRFAGTCNRGLRGGYRHHLSRRAQRGQPTQRQNQTSQHGPSHHSALLCSAVGHWLSARAGRPPDQGGRRQPGATAIGGVRFQVMRPGENLRQENRAGRLIANSQFGRTRQTRVHIPPVCASPHEVRASQPPHHPYRFPVLPPLRRAGCPRKRPRMGE